MISVIIPTKNNGNILEICLRSIRNLNWPEDKIEIIIVDGRSSDNTLEIANKYGCNVIYENIGTRGGACNVGIRSAKGDFVVFTDADCVVSKDWLKNLMEHFNSEKIASVGGPNITPEDDTEFSKCVGEVLSFLSRLGSRYGLNVDRVMETYHNPGCNVAYRKDVIKEAGWFNEKIYCEDEELDYRIKKLGYKFLYIPNAIVFHYRKLTYKRFIKQAYIYAIGRMQVIRLHMKMGKWFHYVPSVVILIIALSFTLSFSNPIFFWVALSILLGGGIGIGLISLYLGSKTKFKNSFVFFALITIWFWGFGFGMFRGLTLKELKRVKLND